MVNLGPIHSLSIILIDSLGTWLILLMFFTKNTRKTNLLFLLTAVSMFGWVNFAYFARVFNDISMSFVYLKIAWFVTPIFFICIYFFSVSFVEGELKYKKLSKIVLIIGLVSSFLTGFTKLIITGTVVKQGNFRILYGTWMMPFLIAVAVIIFATLYTTIREYRSGNLEERTKQQIKYFLIGLSIFYTANLIFNISLPVFLDISRYYFFGDYSTIILLLFIAYAKLRHDLFETKLIAATVFFSIITAAFVFDTILLTTVFLFQVIKLVIIILVVFCGYLLIQGILGEIERRKESEKLSKELHEKTEDLEVAFSELQKLDQAKMEFVSMASHQLRTPISIIRGYISMLEEGDFGHLTEEEQNAIHKTRENISKLAEVVEDILTVGHIESGSLTINKEEYDLVNLIEDVMNELEPEAKNKELYVKLEKNVDQFKMLFDKQKMSQVFVNLIDNALHYTEKGGVTVELTPEKENVRIIISDTGMGIPDEYMKVIFEKFTRAENAKKARPDGSGIGLYLVKKIIQGHSGKISVESKVGEGTKFTITLPTVNV